MLAESNGTSQRGVELNDVEDYLTRWWEFVAQLSNDKAIMGIPSGAT
jgi:hypothetical protein